MKINSKMINSIPKEVKYYSSFRSLAKSSGLYFLARSADVDGSGKVIFSIQDLMEACQRTRPTIIQWVKDCCAAGLFRYCEWLDRHTVVIYYRELNVVSLSLGISEIGLVTYVPIQEFSNRLSVWLTECEAMHLQDQSYWRMYEQEAKKQEKKRPRVNTPADIFRATPQDRNTLDYLHTLSKDSGQRTDKALVYLGNRCAFVSPNFTLFGGSQKTIAERAGLTPRTIQRHLGDDYRTDKGLEPIRKYQLAVVLSKATTEHKRVKKSIDNHYEFANRLFVVGKGDTAVEFFAGCNVYQSNRVNYRYSDRRATKIRNLGLKITSVPKLESITPINYK